MSSDLADEEPRRSLRHSVIDGCAHAVMLGSGEAYLAAFGIFLGLDNLLLAILAALPLFASALAQLATVHLLERARARKPAVVRSARLQALVWLPLFLCPWLFPAHGATFLLVLAMLYFVFNGFIAPAWNSWIGDLVPAAIRGRYFGGREQLRLGLQLVALALAGSTLALSRARDAEWLGFGCIFVAACLARLYSARHLSKMAEPRYLPPGPEHAFGLLDFVRRSPFTDFGRFTVYVALVMAATHVAGPFFSPFMLRDLGFSYLEFTAASCTVLLAQAVAIRHWGKLSDRFGRHTLLRVAGCTIPIVPLFWLGSTSFPAILLWQVLSGLSWAAFNLSTITFLFDAVPPPQRARCVAYYNLLVHSSTFAGALLGGWLAPHLPTTLSAFGFTWTLVSSLQVLFLISGALRGVLALAFLPGMGRVRATASFGAVEVAVTGHAAARGVRFMPLGGPSGEIPAAEEAATSHGDPKQPGA